MTIIESRLDDPQDAVRASPLSRRTRIRHWIRENSLTIGVVAVLLLIVGVPLIFSLDLSFRSGTPANPGAYTFDNYRRAFATPQVGTAFWNTLIYSTCVSAISLAGATFFAWLVERTDMPGRNIAWVLALLPIAIPGMLTSMGWVLLTSSRVGALNVLIRDLLDFVGIHLTEGPLDIYSFPGLIFVESLRGGTALFIIMVAAFRLMDPSLEEAASMSGAGTLRTFRKITLKLMAPALAAAGMFAFVGNLDDLDGPLIIGLPANIFLLPTLIYFVTARGGLWGLAASYTTLFVLFTLVIVFIYHRKILRRSGEFVTVTGKAYRPRRVPLGRWRYPALASFFIYALLTVFLPIAIITWTSLLPGYEAPTVEAFQRLNLDNYRELFSRPDVIQAAINTLWFAVLAATGTMALSLVVAWLVVRQRVRAGFALDSLAFVPHAVPTIAVVIAMVAFYLSPLARWTGLYGTVILMAIAMVTRTITFGTRTMNSSMGQLSGELEEAAYVSGSGRLKTLFKITLRMVMPALLGGWIFVAAMAMRNLTIPLLLSTSSGGTIASELYFYWNRQSDLSGASALGVLMIAALVPLTLIARKYLTSEYGGGV